MILPPNLTYLYKLKLDEFPITKLQPLSASSYNTWTIRVSCSDKYKFMNDMKEYSFSRSKSTSLFRSRCLSQLTKWL